ncbi:MAG: hypothetical protein K6A89_07955 [Treponema sp.]|nr:hypothetical protein [Treponema sp.]
MFCCEEDVVVCVAAGTEFEVEFEVVEVPEEFPDSLEGAGRDDTYSESFVLSLFICLPPLTRYISSSVNSLAYGV